MLSIFNDIKIRFRNIWPALLAILGCLYFGFHAFSGDRGIIRLIELTKQLEESKKMEEDTAAEKAYWQKEVRSLSSGSLDLDKLEEQAIKLINFASPEDFIIVDAKGDSYEQ